MRARSLVGAPGKGLGAIAVLGLVVFLVVPVASLVARAPWGTILSELASPEVASALRLTLICSVSAAALAALFGVPLGLLLARSDFRGRRVVRALVFVPLVLPPVVGGVALLLAFGRSGPIGRVFGLQLPFTTAGAIVAETFVALPFVVLTIEAALRALDPGYEEVAATLGAPPGRVNLLALRLIAPSLGAGLALGWARALGEFGATITFAGNVPGRTQTLPLAVYLLLDTRPEAAIALSVLLLGVAVAVLALVGRRVLR